ncbi:MAG: hypothetical protein GYA57_02075 [Myxococcales bacterium]|nr:hypothetical protein [Myxococcales bacterium]
MTPSARPATFSREALYRAWLDCRRRKRSTPGAVAFELCLADELAALHEELAGRTYRPRPCVRFATRRPKLREIPPRPGFRRRAGFHRRYLSRFVERAVRLRLLVTVVEQGPWVGRTTRQRRVALRVLPAGVATDRKEQRG